jgi:flagellar biosynthesis regulator FlbT
LGASPASVPLRLLYFSALVLVYPDVQQESAVEKYRELAESMKNGSVLSGIGNFAGMYSPGKFTGGRTDKVGAGGQERGAVVKA